MLRNDVAHLCETWQSNTSGTAQASTELSPLFQDSAMVLDLQDWIRQSYSLLKLLALSELQICTGNHTKNCVSLLKH